MNIEGLGVIPQELQGHVVDMPKPVVYEVTLFDRNDLAGGAVIEDIPLPLEMTDVVAVATGNGTERVIKAHRPPHVGEKLSHEARAAIAAAEDARLAEIRSAFMDVTVASTPIKTPIVAK